MHCGSHVTQTSINKMTVEIAFFQTRIYALFALWTLTMVEINDDFFQTKDFQNKLER